MKNFLLIFIYILFTVSGLVFMKLGGESFTFSINRTGAVVGFNWLSIIGFLFYGISFSLWTLILPKYELNFIVPLVIGIVQILTLITALLVFHEKISLLNLIGIIIVVIGIMLINL